jgi:hypothetical protein
MRHHEASRRAAVRGFERSRNKVETSSPTPRPAHLQGETGRTTFTSRMLPILVTVPRRTGLPEWIPGQPVNVGSTRDKTDGRTFEPMTIRGRLPQSLGLGVAANDNASTAR